MTTMANRNRGFVHILVILLLVIAVIVFISPISQMFQKQVNKGVQQQMQPLALIDHTPNFDNLSLSDLPGFEDYRAEYEYNNNLLLIGLNRIVEYDKANNQIVRQNNTPVFDCVNFSAKIKNTLYVSCYKSQKFQNEGGLPYSILYKIDIPGGRVIKTYFEELPPLPSRYRESNDYIYDGRRVNLILAAEGSKLWMSSWDGVDVLDTANDSLTTYSNQDVFADTCRASGIFNNKGVITTIAVIGADCPGRVSIFNGGQNKWEVLDVNPDKYIIANELRWTIDSPFIHLPNFLSISPIINDTYYILGSDGVYSLVANKFPQKIINGSFSDGSDLKTYVSIDKEHLLFMGPIRGPEEYLLSINSTLESYLIDLQKLTVVDLLQDKKFSATTSPRIEGIVNNINNLNMEEVDMKMIFRDPITSEVLILLKVIKVFSEFSIFQAQDRLRSSLVV